MIKIWRDGSVSVIKKWEPGTHFYDQKQAYQGVSRSPHPKIAQGKFQAFLATVPVLPFSLSVAERCAVLRERLKREGKRVKARALDVINAAIALENGLTMVTYNRDDYEDIPDLNLYKIS